MLSGEPLLGLREYIRHNDLSNGCYKCREALHSGNFGAMTATGFDFLRAYKDNGYPRLLEFELSNQCNLECVMCSGRVSSSIRKNREGLDPILMPYDTGFAEQLQEFIPYLKQARFYGGEPFLIDLYYDIWDRMIRINPSVNLYVLTNGNILNDRVKSVLEKGNFTIHVSFDSFNKETYEKIRVNAGFETAMGNLKYFIRYMKEHKQRLCIYVTPTRLNWREIPKMVLLCDLMDTDIYFSTAWYPEDLSLWNLPEEALKEILDHYRTCDRSSSRNGDRFNEMVNDISFWLAGHQKDPGFTEKFKKLAATQEYAPAKTLQEIKASDAEFYKDILTANIVIYAAENSGSSLRPEAGDIMKKIDSLIEEHQLIPVLVLLYLSETDAAEIVRRLQNDTKKNNAAFLQKKQEELLDSYTVI
jgi:molybdenum cofactor biosynthesis enzyme MoaA